MYTAPYASFATIINGLLELTQSMMDLLCYKERTPHKTSQKKNHNSSLTTFRRCRFAHTDHAWSIAGRGFCSWRPTTSPPVGRSSAPKTDPTPHTFSGTQSDGLTIKFTENRTSNFQTQRKTVSNKLSNVYLFLNFYHAVGRSVGLLYLLYLLAYSGDARGRACLRA